MAMIELENICARYEISGDAQTSFRSYVTSQHTYSIKKKLNGTILIDESNVQPLVESWKVHYEEELFLKEEEARISEIARTMPITSGTHFDGYRITHYGGYVSGDEATLLSDSFFGTRFSKDAINNAIKDIRIIAIDELKYAAAQIGCNAVIGLDFDYVNIDRQRSGLSNVIVNETYLILTANGTAVTIEKE